MAHDSSSPKVGIDLHQIIATRYPKVFSIYPPAIARLLVELLKHVLRIEEINDFLQRHGETHGIDFINRIFEYLNFAYSISCSDEQRIPIEGKLICVANHPLGALDAMAIIKAISMVRKDVKVVVNEILCQIANLSEFFLPYDILRNRVQKNNIKCILSALEKHEVVIFFPSAEVSRLTLHGIKDGRWHGGAFYFAHKLNCPILPIHVRARNSVLFYVISILNKRLGMLLLPRELFKQRSKSITLSVGNCISANALYATDIKLKTIMRLLRNHVYRIGRGQVPF